MKKKRIIIVVVLALALAILGAVSLIIQEDEEEKLVKELEELAKEDLTPEFKGFPYHQEVSPNISPEVQELIEFKFLIDKDYLEIGILTGGLKITNKSDEQTIEKATISLVVLDGEGNALEKSSKTIMRYVGRGAIKPGETRTYQTFFDQIDLKELGSAKEAVVTLEDVELSGGELKTTPFPTPPSPSPGSPKEVVDTFFEALKKGEYLEAQQYLSSRSLTQYLKYLNESLGKEYASLEEAWKDNPGQIPQRVEILGEKIREEEKTASVLTNLSLLSGQIVQDWDFDLVRENNVWKIVLP